MDNSRRNLLRLAITTCRRLLEEDYRLQLEGHYSIYPGKSLDQLLASKEFERSSRDRYREIVSALHHEVAQGIPLEDALERFIRESAFTTLNRLAALKLMEHHSRELIQESIGRKDLSKGFQQFKIISPAAMRDRPDGGYRLYLELLMDDLAHALGVLFDRSLPGSILFPSPTCLDAVLEQLNQPDLASIWDEDETIGWIYQYFTPQELRDQARKESSAPRDSYELAFRNQFYTPRYVVAFLADNTLGRMWYGMQQGETKLVDQCAYLIHPPDQPIPDQEKKDPRSMRILDPACGSGHFLLYCFDPLQTIYSEAYKDPDLGPDLQREYPKQEDFQRALPRMILENNLYGIDIDLRATQIAALALWLRAQRAYTELGIPPRQRPRIERSHIVCAEAMPGEYDLLGEFLRGLQPAVLGNLVRDAWDRMRDVGEIGSLLKIEGEIREAIRNAHQTLTSAPRPVQLTLFGPEQPPVQRRLALSEIDDDTFWDQAEGRVLEALERYARQAASNGRITRKLFAHDAAQGFALIDLLKKPFDVVLMNPPFGSPSIGSKEYIKKAYPRTKNDLYATFVERGLELLRPGGYLGAITSRTGFFLKTFQKWREEILLEESNFIAMADLGYGVLDTAMVETAAYVLQKAV